MSTVLFPDENSQAAADDLARSEEDTVVIRLVVREDELRRLKMSGISREDWQEVAERSAELTRELGRAMPPGLGATRRSTVSFWDCRGESFRSWFLAPMLANAAIARAAVAEHEPKRAMVLEDASRPGWWTCRQQVYEPVRAGLLGTGLEPEVHPPLWLRAVRRAALALASPADGLFRRFGGARAGKRGAWMRSLAAPEPADVLFLAIGATSVPIIDRVASALQSFHGLTSAALMFDLDDMGMERASKTDTPYSYIDQVHGGMWEALGTFGRVALAWPWWYLHTLRQVNRTEFGRLLPAVTALLMVALARDSQQTLADIEAAERALDKYTPKVLVSLHLSWYRTAPLVLAAHARGIPVVYLQHGIYLTKDDCTLPLPYDEMLVFGDSAAEALADRAGKTPVTVVGHCVYDDLAGSGEKSPDPGELRQVLLATQPHGCERVDMERANWWARGVALACRELGLSLAVKLHPRELFADGYRRLENQMPGTVHVIQHGERNLHDMIRQSCCLVTVDSTVVLEAALLGTPAMVVNLSGNDDRFPFVADGGAVGVYRFEDILPSLRRVVETGGAELASTREAFLRRHLGIADGHSARRVAAIVARHAGKSSGRRANGQDCLSR
ncbi:MAG: hypothetical protein HPY44_00535 [Armatimonadetes bacterium]|nr:hypothetical protein [Armatimonadota bacterium]